MKMFEKLFFIVMHNNSFWILILSSIIFGVISKLIFKQKVSIPEAGIQIGVSCLIILGSFLLFFQVSSGIKDFDIRNSYVVNSEYYEEWTERCTREVCSGSGKNESCHTEVYYVDHPPYWIINNSIGESISITQTEYKKYVNRFKNETKKGLFHFNQSSFGDGDMYFTEYRNNIAVLTPTSTEHFVVNYLKGSKSIKKRFGNIKGYEKLIYPHPRVYNAGLGKIELDRVISNVSLPLNWKITADRVLDMHMAYLGPKKQVNALLYIVNTGDSNFYYALEEAWINAKKNEVVVVIGVTDFPSIAWVNVMAWSKTENFKIQLRDKILEVDMSDPNVIANIVGTQIGLPAEKGGFERLKMRDLAYLVSDITLPLWIQVIIILIGVGANIGIAVYMVKNEY
jgi:hypothetical protein